MNFFTSTIRNLLKDKTVSFLNMLALTLGSCGAVLLLLNIWFEYSVDDFHANKDRISKLYYRETVNNEIECREANSTTIASSLQRQNAQISSVTRIATTDLILAKENSQVKSEGYYVDSSFLKIFTFPLISGNPVRAFYNLNSIMITQALSTRLFGRSDPISQMITTSDGRRFKIMGLLKDLPDNTDFKFDFLILWNDRAELKNAATYVMLREGVSMSDINNRLSVFTLPDDNKRATIHIFLHPLTLDHLYFVFKNGKPVGGSIDIVHVLAALVLIIMIVTGVNFINLSTARNERRSAEMGIRKVLGASKASLIRHFVAESVLLALVAGIFALMITSAILPAFNAEAGVRRSIPLKSLSFWVMIIGFLITMGILAGSYPAFLLAASKPTTIFKNITGKSAWPVRLRKALIVIQFVASIFLLNFSIYLQKQFRYIEQRPMGFDPNNLFFVALTPDLQRAYPAIKNELISRGIASQVSLSSNPITESLADTIIRFWKDRKELLIRFGVTGARELYVATNGLRLSSGRDLNLSAYPTDSGACLINTTAAKVLELNHPLESRIGNYRIVGVFEDFVNDGPDRSVRPQLVVGNSKLLFLNIRLSNRLTNQGAEKEIKKLLKKQDPKLLAELSSAKELYQRNFRNLGSLAKLTAVFCLISFSVSCIGLFGISIHTGERKAKEISIRKVLGAEKSQIAWLMTTKYVQLVLIAIVIATPLALVGTNLMVSRISYRTDFRWWISMMAAFIALAAAIITTLFQSVKIASSNPTIHLRKA